MYFKNEGKLKDIFRKTLRDYIYNRAALQALLKYSRGNYTRWTTGFVW